jgi:hypothetical protein
MEDIQSVVNSSINIESNNCTTEDTDSFTTEEINNHPYEEFKAIGIGIKCSINKTEDGSGHPGEEQSTTLVAQASSNKVRYIPLLSPNFHCRW